MILRKIKTYIGRAYLNGHFPSFWDLYFSRKQIFAYYGFLGDKNFGDELVFLGTKYLFKDCVLLPILHHSPLHVKLFRHFFDKRVNGIVIGGGTLIGPYFVEKEFFEKVFARQVPVFFHGTGVTPTTKFHSLWNRLIAGADFGGLRGELSLIRTKEGVGVQKKVVGDACFALYETPPKANAKKQVILINYGAHNNYEGQDECKYELLQFAKAMSNKGYEIHFLPMHEIDMEEAKLFEQQVEGVKTLPVPERYDNVRELFMKYEFAVGVRLHFIAMAILCHVPFFSINYKDKHDDLLQSLDLGFAGRRSVETNCQSIMEMFEKQNAFNWPKIDKKLHNLQSRQRAEFGSIIKSSTKVM